MVVYAYLTLLIVSPSNDRREEYEKQRRKHLKFLFVVSEKKLDSERTMPNIIMPSKELLETAQGRVRMLLVVSRQSTSDALVFALVHTIPALLVLVHSSSEALEVTEAIKPDAFVLEEALEELSGVELYDRLHTQPGFTKIPAVLIGGMLSPEQRHHMAKRKVVNLPYPIEPNELQSVLERQLNLPKAPVRSNVPMVVEYNSSSVA
jgi:response regulator RpfG family c-di-GMP phosphodiesterase